MSGLSEDERRSITLSWPHTDNGDLARRCGECVREVESAVDALVAARVKAAKVEALREAADDVTYEVRQFEAGCKADLGYYDTHMEIAKMLRDRADHIEEDR